MVSVSLGRLYQNCVFGRAAEDASKETRVGTESENGSPIAASLLLMFLTSREMYSMSS